MVASTCVEHELVILSPEKTILSYRLAGVGARAGAQAIDAVILLAVMVALSMGLALVASLFPGIISGLAYALLQIGIFLLMFLYFILLEGLWNGLTIGKRAMGIRVRMADGTPVTFFAAISRNLLRPGDFVPLFYFAGLIAMVCNQKSQRLGDMVAGTVVVYERRPTETYVPAPHSVGTHYFESFVGDLRGMTNEEYLALRRFCDRFPELPLTIQERMIQEMWLPIARRRNVPEAPDVHPIYLAEAVVMKYGRKNGLL